MTQRDPSAATVVILVADGARPDTLRDALDAGALPALARLRADGGLHTVSSVFPSVTGPAYTPFLLGRFPGPAGLPGIRWWDRARTATRWPDFARSYVGVGTRHTDADLHSAHATLFELSGNALGSLTPIGRGLSWRRRLGFSWAFGAKAAWAHFRGDVRGWLLLDRATSSRAADAVRRERPRLVFCAHPGIDKISHATGHDHPAVLDALRIVDDTAARIRADAEQDGRWSAMHLWVVSDHGHSPVHQHEDLAELLRAWGHGVRAHPWTMVGGSDAAVMVSGNAMSHIYLELRRRARPYWPALAARWEPLADRLLGRAAVDLMFLTHSSDAVEIRAAGARGRAMVRRTIGRIAYEPLDGGDPLGLGGRVVARSLADAHDACAPSDYPDALVQILQLGASSRAGEIIVSATRGWDFRARYEPIPHVSSHGALHREHMDVPLLLNRPPRSAPRRTTDVMPSALTALGLAVPAGLDGSSFV
ncbi:MAG: alkaline phosphatase family protein [Gemmatimonadaceae bacterium]|nr:alkaline phosphatase family protein [Gemmatimonadaceae bacterium]